ncbi:MAG TPA: type IV pilus twitching motility protein PilT [Bdellovibrionales bacterium]|nr:type IV pilus twitching motility protein PilT [Bdellovibrionales bacterium]
MMTLRQLLKLAIDQGASDIHITVGTPPQLRIDGILVRVRADALDPAECKNLCYSLLTDEQKSRFEETKELDLSFGVKGLARFRANLFFQRGCVAASLRRIPSDVPDMKSLGLPPIIGEFTRFHNGLVLVTGPTGSGKSTTIAALIDKINSEERGHIVTIEDPIEYIHQHKKCIVNQRELGVDTWAFKTALKHILRQDPDYCLIGELRDLETIETALTIAETGHLVFGTLHTNSAIQTINRLVSVFDSGQRDRIRTLLSFVLQGIICQQLLPTVGGGRALAMEILVMTPGIRNQIREDKLHQIQSLMQTGQNKTGMMTMNQSLMSLLVRRKIEMKTAFAASPDPEELDVLLKKAGI